MMKANKELVSPRFFDSIFNSKWYKFMIPEYKELYDPFITTLKNYCSNTVLSDDALNQVRQISLELSSLYDEFNRVINGELSGNTQVLYTPLTLSYDISHAEVLAYSLANSFDDFIAFCNEEYTKSPYVDMDIPNKILYKRQIKNIMSLMEEYDNSSFNYHYVALFIEQFAQVLSNGYVLIKRVDADPSIENGVVKKNECFNLSTPFFIDTDMYIVSKEVYSKINQ